MYDSSNPTVCIHNPNLTHPNKTNMRVKCITDIKVTIRRDTEEGE